MRYPTRVLLSFLVAIGAALALAATLDVAPTSKASKGTWRIVAASGTVEILPPNAPAGLEAWAAVRRGDTAPPRAIVRTGKRGRTTLTRADAVVVLSPHSRIELPTETLTDANISSIVQTDGSVFYEVERRSQPHFEVVTPYLVAGVKGTSFLVTVDEDGATVGVEHGLVEVSDSRGDDSIDLGAGEFVSADRDSGLERFDEDDRDDRRERRREEQTMARLKDARPSLDAIGESTHREDSDSDVVADGTTDDDSDDGDLMTGRELADARDDRLEDGLSDDMSDDLIADDASDESFDQDSRDDESMDNDVYTDDHDASRRDDPSMRDDESRDLPEDPGGDEQ